MGIDKETGKLLAYFIFDLTVTLKNANFLLHFDKIWRIKCQQVLSIIILGGVVLIIAVGSLYHLFGVLRSKKELARLLCEQREQSEELGNQICRLLVISGLQFVERSQPKSAIHSILVSKNNTPVARISVNVDRNFVSLYIQFPNGQNECHGVSFVNLPQVAVNSVLSTLQHIAEGERA